MIGQCAKATSSIKDGNITWNSCNVQCCDKGYRYKDGMGCYSVSDSNSGDSSY